MLRLSSMVFSLFIALLAPFFAVAEDPKPEIIRQGKAATALVMLERSAGSAFCIDRTGYFVTNHHVVARAGSSKIRLVINASEADEKVFPATLLRVDKAADLALLRVEQAGGHEFTTLEMGPVKDLFETQQLIAFGFPFGKALATQDESFPSISVNVGRITALRKTKGTLERIQLDAVLNPGNSGGPVLNSHGQVVGIVRSGVAATDVNFAIPVTKLTGFLAKPELSVASPSIPFHDRFDPLELTIQATRFSQEKPQLEVVVVIGDPKDGNSATTETTGSDGSYRVQVTPIRRPKNGPFMRVALAFANGSIRGKAPECKVVVDETKYALSEIARIERTPEDRRVILKNGKQIKTKRITTGKWNIHFGEYSASIDCDRAETITVYDVEDEVAEVPFTVIAREGTEEVAKATGTIRFERATAAATQSAGGVARRKPYVAPQGSATFSEVDGKFVYQLPTAYSRYAEAGSGRYFLFLLKDERKVVILDVLTGKTAAEIPGVMDDALLAGGREHFVIVLPGQQLVQRWSLRTFEREQVAHLPGTRTIIRALMGANSQGPLLVGHDRGASLVDLQTLKPLEISGVPGGGSSSVHMSYDGSTIATIPIGYGPVSYNVSRIRGSSVVSGAFGSTSSAVRWACPTADGSLLTLPGGGIFDVNRRRVAAKWLDGSRIFPTVDPRYFIAVSFARDDQETDVTQIKICTTADRRDIFTYQGMREMAPFGNTSSRGSVARSLSYGSTQFHYVPWAGVLMSMPRDRQQVMLRKFDLFKELEKRDDYLFVDSVPPTEASKGRTFRYQITAKSKRGEAKFRLESGPAGMTVSKSGLLIWDVPTAYAEDSAQAVVTVANDGKDDVFHSLHVAVVD